MSVDAIARAQPSVTTSWAGDLRCVRIMRFGFGVALAMAIAFGFDWPLQFLLPVLTVSLLGTRQPAPTLRDGFNSILYIQYRS